MPQQPFMCHIGCIHIAGTTMGCLRVYGISQFGVLNKQSSGLAVFIAMHALPDLSMHQRARLV